MHSLSFTTALGNPRVLADSLSDGHRRVLAYDGDQVVGVAAFEPLFGHQAEAAIAVAPGSSGSLVPFLLDGLLELATKAGITVVRFVFTITGQRATAARLRTDQATTSLRFDRLEIRTSHGLDRCAQPAR